MSRLGQTLKRYRQMTRLKVIQVSAVLGVSDQYYYTWETGDRPPPWRTLLRLADLYEAHGAKIDRVQLKAEWYRAKGSIPLEQFTTSQADELCAQAAALHERREAARKPPVKELTPDSFPQIMQEAMRVLAEFREDTPLVWWTHLASPDSPYNLTVSLSAYTGTERLGVLSRFLSSLEREEIADKLGADLLVIMHSNMFTQLFSGMTDVITAYKPGQERPTMKPGQIGTIQGHEVFNTTPRDPELRSLPSDTVGICFVPKERGVHSDE